MSQSTMFHRPTSIEARKQDSERSKCSVLDFRDENGNDVTVFFSSKADVKMLRDAVKKLKTDHLPEVTRKWSDID